jgi:hypothetical protein
MKKPKRPKLITKRASLSTAAAPISQQSSTAAAPISSPQGSKGWWSKLMAIAKGLGSVGTALGLLYMIMHFWPQISVEPTATADSSNPLSGYYKITNEQGYPLTDVSVEASLRCARIGRGNNTSPMDKCEPSMHTSKRLWTNHTLEPHEPYEITPGDIFFVTPPTALLYAQISIFVSYKLWKLPIPFPKKEFRFQSRRLSDGKIEWLHLPAD